MLQRMEAGIDKRYQILINIIATLKKQRTPASKEKYVSVLLLICSIFAYSYVVYSFRS